MVAIAFVGQVASSRGLQKTSSIRALGLQLLIQETKVIWLLVVIRHTYIMTYCQFLEDHKKIIVCCAIQKR